MDKLCYMYLFFYLVHYLVNNKYCSVGRAVPENIG